MSSLSDALEHPAKVVSSLYRGQDIDQFPGIVAEHFRSLFKSDDAFQKIPALDVRRTPQSFPDGSLVVFNAMVQDTSLSPELYLAILNGNACGGWGITETTTTPEDVQPEHLRERSVFWAISIPGLSAWCVNGGLPDASTFQQSAQPHKFPVPNASHVGAQLKIYDNKLAQSIRVTNVMSFIGILTFEPLHANIDYPDPVNVPTLHVLFMSPLPSTIVPRAFPDSTLSTVGALRQELIRWIADEALAGDLIASEFVLLCSIARVRSRHPPILPLSMTLSGFPSPPDALSATPTLYHVLAGIFPLVALLPLSIETLNNASFYPESKEENLHSGYLQHPKGTVLLLTEGQVMEGQIFDQGVKNIHATQEMMTDQTISYMFPFSKFQFETDVNFVVTTEGTKSTFFRTDLNVPFSPTTLGNLRKALYRPREAVVFPSAEKLSQFRQLVGGSKIGHVNLGEHLGKYIEEDFVQGRLSGHQMTPSSDDLIKRMVLARLVSLSHHHVEMTIQDWESVKALERHTQSHA
ncbi:hypothetical protein CVT26_009833 [Gymnopilus dilepis]|uniref:Uncharacterized protein n=1 Tax=Gymnopilus dilepis TaxID=231916 RepID=A0A409VKX7_9AGAR|nr:hypothetical protein CVT26_009833 [Gymnopilus dilepis]